MNSNQNAKPYARCASHRSITGDQQQKIEDCTVFTRSIYEIVRASGLLELSDSTSILKNSYGPPGFESIVIGFKNALTRIILEIRQQDSIISIVTISEELQQRHKNLYESNDKLYITTDIIEKCNRQLSLDKIDDTIREIEEILKTYHSGITKMIKAMEKRQS